MDSSPTTGSPARNTRRVGPTKPHPATNEKEDSVGSVYSRKATKFLWIKYLQHGRVIRESTQTDNIVKARRMLRDREGDVEKGVPITPDVGRITFDDASADLLNDYSINRKKTYDDARRRIRKHLSPFFGNRRMITITTTELRAYVTKRLADGTPDRRKREDRGTEEGPRTDVAKRPVSAGEINRELTVLKRMFSLAIQAGKLVHKPHFPMLRENNVRAGFFEREQYLSVLRHLPTSMQPVVTFAFVTGWRINSEVLPLEWRQVDLKLGEVRLDPGTTKNLEGRVFYLTSELKELLKAQRKAANRVQRGQGMIVQHVFFHDSTTKAGAVGFRSGHRISEHGLYQAWCRARIAAGCPGSIPHDFRRTAIRNMVRAGIPERVAMKLSGHKTRSVFDRYKMS
jgi:integrase-like protein